MWYFQTKGRIVHGHVKIELDSLEHDNVIGFFLTRFSKLMAEDHYLLIWHYSGVWVHLFNR